MLSIHEIEDLDRGTAIDAIAAVAAQPGADRHAAIVHLPEGPGDDAFAMEVEPHLAWAAVESLRARDEAHAGEIARLRGVIEDALLTGRTVNLSAAGGRQDGVVELGGHAEGVAA